MNDMAVVDDVDPARQCKRRGQILLYQYDGLSGGGQIAAGFHQIANDHRRQPLERLVEKNDLGVAHQRAGNRQHLLFAAGQIGTAAAAALLQAREHRVDTFERPFLRRSQSGEDDVLLDAEAAEDAAVFRHQLHAGLGDDVALPPGEVDTVEQHFAAPRRQYAHQALECRRLAGTVAPEQCHDLVALDAQRDIEQNMRVRVIGIQA